MKTIKERLEFIMNSEGLRQKDIAEITGSSPQSVNNWIKRDAISRFAAQSLSEKLGYSLSWILIGEGSPKIFTPSSKQESSIPPESEWGTVDAWDSNTPLPDDEVEVPFLKDIELAAGDGSFCDEDYNGYKIRFSKATLRRVGAQAENVVCFPARGNSMEPVIPDGTTVAIDCANKKINDGDLYAIATDGMKRIKQLYRRPGGIIVIRSFNRDEYQDEEVKEPNLEIIGRMFWSSTLW